MRRWVIGGLLAAYVAAAQPDAESLLEQIRERMHANLTRMPDYTCRETVERMVRTQAGAAWRSQDTLRLEVALSGNREMYSWAGASRFEERELADMIGRGTVGTGNFALHAKTIFLTDAAEISYAGKANWNDRYVHRFNYSIPAETSRYRLRIPPNEAVVAYGGNFLVDPDNLDLLRLEVHVTDMPEKLGIVRASDVMEYARVPIGDSDFLLPKSSELTMAGAFGDESLNRASFGECRQYTATSTVAFAGDSGDGRAAAIPALPPGLALEVELDRDIPLDTVNVGDVVQAKLARPAADLPEGAAIQVRIVRLERQSLPFDHYVVSLQLESVQDGPPLTATMQEVSSAPGLIKEARRLNPTFTRKRSPRMEILVREQQKGEGILHWDARKPKIGRGLRMLWRTETQ
jgi:hypothetical protein